MTSNPNSQVTHKIQWATLFPIQPNFQPTVLIGTHLHAYEWYRYTP